MTRQPRPPGPAPAGKSWCAQCGTYHDREKVQRQLGFVAKVGIDTDEPTEAVRDLVQGLVHVLPPAYLLVIATQIALGVTRQLNAGRPDDALAQAAVRVSELVETLRSERTAPIDLIALAAGLLTATRLMGHDAFERDTAAWRERASHMADEAERQAGEAAGPWQTPLGPPMQA